VSYRFPFIRLIKQNLKGISYLRRTFFGTWRSSALPRRMVPVNESIHPSAATRFGKRVRVRRGEEVTEIVYRPRNLKVALRK
jgi:hypothetical protein